MSASARAIVIDRPGEHRLVSGPQAEPGPGEARVTVHTAGVSRSDRELYDGTRPPALVRYPVIPGHEWSGTVDAVGEGAPPELLGRKVVAEGFRACLVCDRCREGAGNLCTRGYEETGFTRPGAFGDSLLVPARLLHVLADCADLRAAALLAPAAVSAAAVLAGVPRPGDRIAVVGAGTLGLLALQLLAACSPAELVAIDPRVQRCERALRMGATQAGPPGENSVSYGRFDLVVEAAGAFSAAQEACLLVRRGGRVVLTGMFGPGAEGIDPEHLVEGQLTVRAVFGAPPSAWSHAVRAWEAGFLDPVPLITHELPLTAFGEAMALVGSEDPAVGKVLLTP
ncbi:alcohol dehydrogenase catalytic domain-containing protein [Streptomyces sp. N2-109]|uniref:Alcohol dehydrogenase catalytic domain-containing protein n=1 Tax=Streptomyces gossypii TaxID=2883101 RepID=A0ABT2JR96_9ACTN|nr:alcohol dehydrogenase catalytic domain-containing protein [Streptomyces gossypii]MCT2590276.1 alcohol dehydrogenase catalytic domain-containing protein [Streptomyces gossypii]